MTHLSPQEIVDHTEGTLDPERVAHVTACTECRKEADRLQFVLLQAGVVEVPEPSPLFWEYLSSRVTAAVAGEETEPAPSWSRWRDWSVGRFTAAVTTVAVVLAVVVGLSMLRYSRTGVEVVSDAVGNGGAVDLADTDLGSSDESDWTLLVTMADAVDWQDSDTDGLLVGRQAIDGAVFQLSDGERRELVRLLEAEWESGSR